MGRQPEKIKNFSHYRYYTVPGRGKLFRAVRVAIDKDGFERRAEMIDPATGEFGNSTGILSEIHEGPFTEDSTEEEFNRLCAAQRTRVDQEDRQESSWSC